MSLLHDTLFVLLCVAQISFQAHASGINQLLGKILRVTKLFFVLLSSINLLPWFSTWSK